jgi:hypothetical protein
MGVFMKKYGIIVFLTIFLTACAAESTETVPITTAHSLQTANFIEMHLLKDGKVQTNVTDLQEDYLAESIGLWLMYLVEAKELERFTKQVNQLEKQFLLKNHLISWQITGTKQSPVSALIDELRIVEALYMAYEQWGNPAFQQLAKKMEEAIQTFEKQGDVLVDFYDTKTKAAATSLTLSYIKIPTINRMGESKTFAILQTAPTLTNGFYPLNYDVQTKQYNFPKEINLIDQFYIGYHLALAGENVSHFIAYIEQALEKEGKLFGRIDGETFLPTVTYESPSVYALAMMLSMEAEEWALAKQLYMAMVKLKVNDPQSAYYGGYIDVSTLQTHAFDNLLPLIAERRLLDAKVF